MGLDVVSELEFGGLVESFWIAALNGCQLDKVALAVKVGEYKG